MSAPTLDNVPRPRAMGFGVALGDRLFRLAIGPGRQLEIVTAPLEAPRVNTTSSAEEAAAEFGLTFARSAFDGGAGLLRAHAEGAEPNRFWDSKGVDVSVPVTGEVPQIRLLHEIAQVEASSVTGLRMAYSSPDDALYLCEGSTLRRTDNPSAAIPTWNTDNPGAGETVTTVHDVATLGNETYVALGSLGIHRKVSGTWAHWSDTPATRVWAIKGRIIASDGRNLYEVTTAGATPTPVIILAPGVEFADCCDGGAAILAGASDGYVYSFSTETGTLVLASQTLFESEQVRALGQSQGVVAVGTSQGNIGRFYVGTVGQDGQVVDQQLIREWGTSGSATPHYPYRVLGTRDSLYTGIADGTDSCLWRYDLISAGMSRSLCMEGASGAIQGIESVDGKIMFSVDGVGVQVEQSTYVESGWLIGPLGDFYTSQSKTWVSARLDTSTLDGGRAVELHQTPEQEALSNDTSPEWTRVVRREAGMGDPGEVTMTPVVSRSLAGMVRLFASSDRTATPAVYAFSFRAYPSSGEGDGIITLPINVSDQIERRGRRRVRVKGRGETEFAALRSLEGKPAVMRLFKPALTVRGLVEEVATPVLAMPSRGSATLVSQVRVRGRYVGAGVTTGIGSLGTDRLLGSDLVLGGST